MRAHTCTHVPASTHSSWSLQVRAELFDIARTTLVSAHDTSLSCIALNVEVRASQLRMRPAHSRTGSTGPGVSLPMLLLQGTRLATASERGTLVRIWDTRSGQRVLEVHSPLAHTSFVV